MRECWIIKGCITDADAHSGYNIGDTEWQVSDGPAGKRSISADYPTLEQALMYAAMFFDTIHVDWGETNA
jgi:hypothetical protein